MKFISRNALPFCLSVFIGFSSFFSTFVHAQQKRVFEDLAMADALYTPYIKTMRSQGLIYGYTDKGQFTGTFGPNDLINRAEFSKMVTTLRLAEKQGVSQNWKDLNQKELDDLMNQTLVDYYNCEKGACRSLGGEPFLDVPEKPTDCDLPKYGESGCEPWYGQYVYYSVSEGFVKGYPVSRGREFRAGERILRLHALKMILTDNGNIDPEDDRRFSRLSNQADSLSSFSPKCLKGSEQHILGNNMNGIKDYDDAEKLLKYALLADRLDFFGNECQAFKNSGAIDPQAVARYLQQPMTRKEAVRWMSIASEYSPVNPDPATDGTINSAQQNGVSSASEKGYSMVKGNLDDLLKTNHSNSESPTGKNEASKVAWGRQIDEGQKKSIVKNEGQENGANSYGGGNGSSENKEQLIRNIALRTAESLQGRCCITTKKSPVNSCKIINFKDYKINPSGIIAGSPMKEIWHQASNESNTCWIPYKDITSGYYDWDLALDEWIEQQAIKMPSFFDISEIKTIYLQKIKKLEDELVNKKAKTEDVKKVYEKFNLKFKQEVYKIYGDKWLGNLVAKIIDLTFLDFIEDSLNFTYKGSEIFTQIKIWVSKFINGEPKKEFYFDIYRGTASEEKFKNEDLYIIIHGFLSESKTEWVNRIAESILSTGKKAGKSPQILMLDWSDIVDNINIWDNAKNIDEISDILGKSLKEWGIKPDKTTIIGHSLGTIMGASLSQKINPDNGVSTLVALDPAEIFLSKDYKISRDKINAYFDGFSGKAEHTLCLAGSSSFLGGAHRLSDCNQSFLVDFSEKEIKRMEESAKSILKSAFDILRAAGKTSAKGVKALEAGLIIFAKHYIKKGWDSYSEHSDVTKAYIDLLDSNSFYQGVLSVYPNSNWQLPHHNKIIVETEGGQATVLDGVFHMKLDNNGDSDKFDAHHIVLENNSILIYIGTKLNNRFECLAEQCEFYGWLGADEYLVSDDDITSEIKDLREGEDKIYFNRSFFSKLNPIAMQNDEQASIIFGDYEVIAEDTDYKKFKNWISIADGSYRDSAEGRDLSSDDWEALQRNNVIQIK